MTEPEDREDQAEEPDIADNRIGLPALNMDALGDFYDIPIVRVALEDFK